MSSFRSNIIRLAANPSLSPGYDAAPGERAEHIATGFIYIKNGLGLTDWALAEDAFDPGTSTPTPDSVPISTDDGTLAVGWLPPGLNDSVQYVSPAGDDSYDGLTLQTAKETIYEGIQAIRAGGGGTLYIDSGSQIGGPVSGQGIWLRTDYQIGANHYFDVPGFLPLDVPMNIVGIGRTGNLSPFAPAPMAEILGSDRSQFKPAIWIVGSPASKPLTITGLQSPFANARLGMRLWVDFDRELNGDVKQIPVSNATRTGTSTVLTVDINGVTPIVVTQAERYNNVTTLHITNPGLPFTPWHPGVVIRFTSGDADFASGDYTITSMSSFESDNNNWTLSYTEVAANAALQSVAASSVRSHGCFAGELLWLSSTNGEFIEQQYYVTSATASTITLEDNFGSGDADEDDIGTIAHQERLYGRSTNVQLNRLEMGLSGGLQEFGATHGFDIGSSLAAYLEMTDCACGGAMLQDGIYNDPRCFEALYAYGGGDARSGTAIFLSRCTSNNGGFFLESRGTGSAMNAVECLVEQSSDQSDRPGIRVWGNSFTSVFVDRFENADGATDSNSVEILGCPDYGPVVTRSGKVLGKVIGGDAWDSPGDWAGSRSTPWQGGNTNGMQVCVWADGRITGKHPGAARAGGVLGVRFKNFVLQATDWSPASGATVTPGGGVAAPDGGPSDLIVTVGGVSSVAITLNGQNTVPGGNITGGRFVMCGWINSDVPLGTSLVTIYSNQFTLPTFGPGSGNTGWQFVSDFKLCPAASGASFYAALNTGANSSISVRGLTLVWVPADVSDNDFYEFAGTIKYQPFYLLPGDVGTMEGQPFIAHGGLGVDSAILVGPSGGVASLANYEPRYDDDGSTVLGYVPLMATAGGALAASPGGAAGGDLTGTYPNPTIGADKVTYAQMQNVSAASKLLGRGSAGGAGDTEEITVGSGLTMTGTTLTGNAGSVPTGTGFRHVTAGVEDAASALVQTADISDDQVTYAKVQNVSATDRLLGRDTAAAGNIEELTATGGLEFTGTGIRTTAFTGDVTKAAGGTALTLAVAPFAVVNASLATANATIDVNGQQVTSSAAPSGANSFANKAYVDSVAAGLDPKANGRALADSNIASLSGLAQTIDGVAINTDGYRVLLIAQSTATQNGLWVAHSGAWTRPTDFAAGSDAAGAYCFIELGTLYAALGFICNTPAGSAVVDTNNLTFQQFSGAGQVNAGTGMTKTGNTLNVNANADGSIICNADDIQAGPLLLANVPNDLITYAKIQNVSAASKLLGRGDSGSGDVQEITLGANLTMTGTTLAATGGGGSGTWTDFVQNVGKGFSGTFDITGLSGLTADKNVAIIQTAKPIASKGNARDEFQFDAIQLTGYVVDATTIRAQWWAPGVVVGDYAMAYQVGG